MKLLTFSCVLMITALAYAESRAWPQSSGSGSEFTQLADRYFDEYYFPFNPTQGTLNGFHQYDSRLEDYSQAANVRQVATLKKFEQEIAVVDADPVLCRNTNRARKGGPRPQ